MSRQCPCASVLELFCAGATLGFHSVGTTSLTVECFTSKQNSKRSAKNGRPARRRRRRRARPPKSETAPAPRQIMKVKAVTLHTQAKHQVTLLACVPNFPRSVTSLLSLDRCPRSTASRSRAWAINRQTGRWGATLATTLTRPTARANRSTNHVILPRNPHTESPRLM